jgi:O-antigen ligase
MFALTQAKPLDDHRETGDGTIRLLQIFVVTLMVIPSGVVFAPLGASGYVASIVGMLCFATWFFGMLFALHNPFDHRSPIRIGFGALWVVSLISYALINRYVLPHTTVLAADRWILQLLACTGVALLAAETLRSAADIRRVTRALVWAAAFSGFVAALQFWFKYDITPALRAIPLMESGEETVFQPRGALTRVSGTALHPIELGVTSAIILPLAVWLAIGDQGRPAIRRWAPSVFIAVGILTSISRSGILAAALSLGFLIAALPVRQRLVALAIVPLATAGVLMTAKGLIRTLLETFLFTSNESRTDDYSLAANLMSDSAWFGQGGGTYMTTNILEIFDNQFVKTAVELGLPGVVGLLLYLALPMSVALSARRRLPLDPQLRMLCAVAAGASAAATVGAVTFDAMAYPQFVGAHAIAAGFAGACWLISREQPSRSVSVPSRQHVSSAEMETL